MYGAGTVKLRKTALKTAATTMALKAIAFVLVIAALPTTAEQLGVLDYKRLPEASGIAVSGRVENRLWFINDSGNRAELIALDHQTGEYGTVKLRKHRNKDWEALASFIYEGEPWLAVADVGDNDAKREFVSVFLLPEPDLESKRVDVHATIRLDYPDGPRDVESIAVDSVSQTLLLLSKRDESPVLYRAKLPELTQSLEFTVTADRLGTVTSIPPPSAEVLRRFPRFGRFHSQPTGMTLLRDGSGVALLTYGGVYLANRGEGETLLDSINNNLCKVPSPQLEQAESIASDSEGRLYVTSEGRRAPLHRIEARCALRDDSTAMLTSRSPIASRQ